MCLQVCVLCTMNHEVRESWGCCSLDCSTVLLYLILYSTLKLQSKAKEMLRSGVWSCWCTLRSVETLGTRSPGDWLSAQPSIVINSQSFFPFRSQAPENRTAAPLVSSLWTQMGPGAWRGQWCMWEGGVDLIGWRGPKAREEQISYIQNRRPQAHLKSSSINSSASGVSISTYSCHP